MNEKHAATEASIEYLRTLFEPEDHVVIQLIHATQKFKDKDSGLERNCTKTFLYPVGKVDAAVIRKLSKLNAAGWNVFVCMSAIKPQEGAVRRTKSMVSAVRAVYVNADEGGDEALRKIKEDREVPQPHFVLQSSPGKYHVAWLVEGFDVPTQEALNFALARRFGTDPSARDATRVLRLPGFRNVKMKYPDKPLVTVVSRFDAPRYRMGDFKIEIKPRAETPIGAPISSEEIVFAKTAVENYLKRAGVEFSPIEETGLEDWEWRWPVICPNAAAHTEDTGLASLFLARDGKFGYNCFHGHCEGKGWRWFRETVEERLGEKMVLAPPKPPVNFVSELNKEFFVVQNLGSKCRVAWLEPDPHPDLKDRLVLGHQGFDDFRNSLKNIKVRVGTRADGGGIYKDKGGAWLDHPDRRQYKTVVFAPGRDLGPRILNLWRGFAFQPQSGNCSLYLRHVWANICQRDHALYQWVIRWLARGAQRPWERGHTALVLRGEQGVGKNFFAEKYGELFGTHFLTTADAEQIVGRFNSHLRTCSVLFGNEAFFAGNKTHERILKMLITDPVLPIEGKFVNVVQAPNLLHVVLGSNSDWVVPASIDDRRFCVLDVGGEYRKDTEYFAAIQRQLDEGGYAALLNYLLKIDLSRFEPRNAPKTAGLRDQMFESLAGAEAAWFECLQSGEIPGSVEKDGTARMRGSTFIEWAGKREKRWSGIKTEHVGHLLGKNPRARTTRKGMGFVKGRHEEAGEFRQIWFVPPLAECRKLWGSRRFPGNWDTTEGDWTTSSIPR